MSLVILSRQQSTDSLSYVIKSHVLNLYRKNNSNKASTAKALGIHKSTLSRMLHQWEIQRNKDIRSLRSRPKALYAMEKR